MSNRLTTVTAVAFPAALLFAVACGGGSSGSSTGTSGGVATTTGGTTGAATTGGALSGGAQCSANAQCNSAVCGLNGSGNCCTVACSTADAMCGATGCDGTGACLYPDAGTSCANFCGAGNQLTQKFCDAAGTCAASAATSCTGNFACNSAGTGCNTMCASSTDCASGYVCNKTACVAPTVVGSCTENDDCFSQHCGISGSGHCCVGSGVCATSDATCGATDCDAVTGACNYADAGTACGSIAASCSNGTQQDPSVCDGKGTCPTPATAPCTPFICGASACLTTCTDDTSCGSGDFCDTAHSTCCNALASGASINVDATGGNDAAACCSTPGGTDAVPEPHAGHAGHR